MSVQRRTAQSEHIDSHVEASSHAHLLLVSTRRLGLRMPNEDETLDSSLQGGGKASIGMRIINEKRGAQGQTEVKVGRLLVSGQPS